MKVKVGCDIARIKRFERLDNKVLDKIFNKNELKNKRAESLAGIFAAKESVKKVFNDLDWHDIEIKKEKSGKPLLILHKKKEALSYDISISHDGKYAFAVAAFVMEN
jgi:phosphopantetheine--protein transferase-like protein